MGKEKRRVQNTLTAADGKNRLSDAYKRSPRCAAPTSKVARFGGRPLGGRLRPAGDSGLRAIAVCGRERPVGESSLWAACEREQPVVNSGLGGPAGSGSAASPRRVSAWPPSLVRAPALLSSPRPTRTRMLAAVAFCSTRQRRPSHAWGGGQPAVTAPHLKTAKEREEEQHAPLYVYLTTYFSYMVLIVYGHIRDFFGQRFRPDNYKHLREQNVSSHGEAAHVVGGVGTHWAARGVATGRATR